MSNYGSYSNEYLITNNFGSYSSANYIYGNTRKYHGLLVATQDHLLKYNILNRIIESYKSSNSEVQLATNIYQNNVISPEGYNFQTSFAFFPLPSWTFKFGNTEVIKTLLLLQNENSLLLRYQITTDESGFFNLKPLINFRDIHSVNSSNPDINNLVTEQFGDHVKIELQQSHNLFITHPGSTYIENQEIYFNFYYPDEAERGYLSTENLLHLGDLESPILPGKTELYFKFSYNNISEENTENLWDKNTPKTHEPLTKTETTSSSEGLLKTFQNQLENQARFFINTGNNQNGICAGYHWFDEWSRDTFISLPGLTFTKDKLDIAENILADWGAHLKDGLLPNRLLLTDMLNSLDSVFWFTVRLYQFSLIKNNFDLAEKFLSNLENVFLQFQQKTHNIAITQEGFLYDHNNSDALTWMDAKVDGRPVIDRSGMAVEIQALWYNYIRIMVIFKEQLNDRTHLTYLKELKVALEKNFEKTFWNYYQNCLFDCVRMDYTDRAIRPNQVIAVYLPFKLLGSRKNKMVLATVEQKLLTDVGLRTLAREDPNFINNYSGDQKTRDLSYHQGTIWPFLLGFYLCAYYDTFLKTKSAKTYVTDRLLAFQSEITKQKLNYIPEIFSAEDLSPQGCIAQAWSVAMLLETIYHLDNN